MVDMITKGYSRHHARVSEREREIEREGGNKRKTPKNNIVLERF